jgi:hypothetical protein
VVEINKSYEEKEVEIIFIDLYKTTKWNVFILEFLTEDGEIFYLPFVYEGSWLDARAKYSRDEKIFEFLFEEFFHEIALALRAIWGRKRKAA